MDLKKLKDNKGQVVGNFTGMVIGLAIAIIVFAVIGTNVATDSILGSSTTHYETVSTILYAGFVVLGVGTLAFVGRWIMQMFS